MSDIPFLPTSLSDMVGDGGEVAGVARNLAARLASPSTLSADQRPITMSRRMAVVTTVNAGPPVTADVDLNGVTIPGISPQSTYRPLPGDIVWLEFMGADAHISPPLTSDDNFKWRTLTLGSGWTTYAGAWDEPLRYYRDPLGFVHLKGSVAGGAMGSTISTLPLTYRPNQTYAGFSCYCFGGAGMQAGGVAIQGSTGNILYEGPSSPVQVALDGITFRVD